MPRLSRHSTTHIRLRSVLSVCIVAILLLTGAGCDSDDFLGDDGVYGIVSAALALAAAIISVV